MDQFMYVAVRKILELYNFLPWAPLANQAARWLERRYPRSCKVVHRKRNGVWLELDLGRFIDFEIFYGARFEQALVTAIKPIIKPGMTVVDVGANSGFYTMVFSSLVGETGCVWAFEPTDWGARAIARQVGLNNFKNIRLVRAALTSDPKTTEGIIEFDPYYPLFSDCYQHRASTEIVRSTSIDALFSESNQVVDLIKIDVDGPELSILRGAVETIKNSRPILVLEVGVYTYRNAGSSVDQLVTWLHEQGYQILYENDLSLLETAGDVISCIPNPEQNTINVICMPIAQSD